MTNYILTKEGRIKKEPDVIKWAKWFEKGGRFIKRTDIGKKWFVSTVFLGLDYGFGHTKKPILFETMVFEQKLSTHKGVKIKGDKKRGIKPVTMKPFKYHKSLDEFSERYQTKAWALKDHARIVKELKARAGIK